MSAFATGGGDPDPNRRAHSERLTALRRRIRAALLLGGFTPATATSSGFVLTSVRQPPVLYEVEVTHRAAAGQPITPDDLGALLLASEQVLHAAAITTQLSHDAQSIIVDIWRNPPPS